MVTWSRCRSLSGDWSIDAVTLSCKELLALQVVMALLGCWTRLSLVIYLHHSFTDMLVSCALSNLSLGLMRLAEVKLLRTSDST